MTGFILLHNWVLHPLYGKGYQLWSGVASDVSEIAIFTGLGVFWTKHNCHEHRCLRLSWHPDAKGHPVCKVHHLEHPAKSWFRSDKTHPRHARNRK